MAVVSWISNTMHANSIVTIQYILLHHTKDMKLFQFSSLSHSIIISFLYIHWVRIDSASLDVLKLINSHFIFPNCFKHFRLCFLFFSIHYLIEPTLLVIFLLLLHLLSTHHLLFPHCLSPHSSSLSLSFSTYWV